MLIHYIIQQWIWSTLNVERMDWKLHKLIALIYTNTHTHHHKHQPPAHNTVTHTILTVECRPITKMQQIKPQRMCCVNKIRQNKATTAKIKWTKCHAGIPVHFGCFDFFENVKCFRKTWHFMQNAAPSVGTHSFTKSNVQANCTWSLMCTQTLYTQKVAQIPVMQNAIDLSVNAFWSNIHNSAICAPE